MGAQRTATSIRSVDDLLADRDLACRNDVLLASERPGLLRGLPRRLLSAVGGANDGAVLVATGDPSTVARERFGGAVATDLVGVVDCTPDGGALGDPASVEPDADRLHWSVDSPGRLTDAGIALSDCLDALDRRGVETTHLVYDSLSSVLVSTDPDRAVQYAHQLTCRRGVRDGLGLYPVYTDRTTGRALERLKHLFDGMVEVRERGGVRQARCRGFAGTPEGWVTLASPGRRRASSD